MPEATAHPQTTAEQAVENSVRAGKLKFAIKTALSLTLAYLIPMALGWPQPQTAATTVMLIAATGLLSESLQKGLARIVGTVIGASIGLTLIALYPQDRMVYLFTASIAVSIAIYLYNAYQGDSSVFMLAAVVILMVFNGGNAEGAFLYGVDRTFMTAFGVIIYSLVGSMLWPVKVVDNTMHLAAKVSNSCREAFSSLHSSAQLDPSPEDQLISDLLETSKAFQAHYVSVRQDADGVKAYASEWLTIEDSFIRLQSILISELRHKGGAQPDYNQYITDYKEHFNNIEHLFEDIEASWSGDRSALSRPFTEVTQTEKLATDSGHIVIAAVAARAEMLSQLQKTLVTLLSATHSLMFERSALEPLTTAQGKSSFIWLDRENFKTAIRAFVTFWIATTVWIQFNPPGGFMFVTLSVALIPLVSYTPVTPKLLYILFTLGFLFALPAYVFLLPTMTHWLELGLFLFAYAFFGFFVFPGPVAIFFLLGLFTLGIQNTMAYHFDVILIITLMFYMVCTMEVLALSFPFTSKPQLLYYGSRQRFLLGCSSIIRHNHGNNWIDRILVRSRLASTGSLLNRMQSWGANIDSAYFDGSSEESVTAFNRSCDILLGQLQALNAASQNCRHNPLIMAMRSQHKEQPIAELCQHLAHASEPEKIEADFEAARTRLNNIEQELDDFMQRQAHDNISREQWAEFYVNLHLQISILSSLDACAKTSAAINWSQLRDSRF